MEKQYLIMAVIVVNIVILGLLVAFKASKLSASGDSPQGRRPANQRLMTGVSAFIGIVVFVVLIAMYFVRQGGGLGG